MLAVVVVVFFLMDLCVYRKYIFSRERQNVIWNFLANVVPTLRFNL